MTPAKARQLGYRIIAASPFEVGLVLNGVGIRTWWARDFGGELPTLHDPKVMHAINLNERLKNMMPRTVKT